MATRRELCTRLAILTAAEKAVKRAKEEARADARDMMREAYAEDGISGLDMLIGDVKVGRIGVSKPTVGIAGGSSYAGWAYENGMGKKLLTADVSDASQDLLDEIAELLRRNAVDYEFNFHADEYAKKTLRVAGDRVVDDNGEIVPGAYVKVQDIRVTGCKPEDVGSAMAQMGDGTTLAGLLTGGE